MGLWDSKGGVKGARVGGAVRWSAGPRREGSPWASASVT